MFADKFRVANLNDKKHDHLILSSFLVDLKKNIKFCVVMDLFKMIIQRRKSIVLTI